MIFIDISPNLLHDEVREVSAALPFDKEVRSMKTVWNRFGLLCVIFLCPLLLYAVGAWGLMLLPGPVCGPPEDVMLTFDSDQEMADRCGCLTYDMAGLTVDSASRTLRCLSGGEEDPDRWDQLDADYTFSGENQPLSALSVHVYFENRTSTETFPDQNFPQQRQKIDGTLVFWQQPQDSPLIYDVLFQHSDYTYQLRLELADGAEESLESCLSPILP